MPADSVEQRIARTLRSLPRGLLEVRLAAVADRDLAIAVHHLISDDADLIRSHLPPAKARRVAQEQTYLQRLYVSPAHRQRMMEHLAQALEGHRSSDRGTWIAPGGRTS